MKQETLNALYEALNTLSSDDTLNHNERNLTQLLLFSIDYSTMKTYRKNELYQAINTVTLLEVLSTIKAYNLELNDRMRDYTMVQEALVNCENGLHIQEAQQRLAWALLHYNTKLEALNKVPQCHK